MYMEGFKCSLVKDTSYKGLWKVSFTLQEFQERGAIMYPVSDKYKAAIRDSTRKFYYSGKIITKGGTEYPFENKDIVKGSAYVTNQCCGDSEIEIGSVYVTKL